MLPGLDRSRGILLALILSGPLSLAGFRCFITLDGPLHALRAELLRDHLGPRIHDAADIHYDFELMPPRVGDVLMMPFTGWLSPESVHVLYGALVLAAIAFGAWMLVRACGHRPGMGLLWIAPISFGWIFILGFFPFMLATALAFMAAAGWMHARVIRWWLPILLLPAMFVLANTHRAGVVLLAAMLLGHEAIVLVGDRAIRDQRWSRFPRRLPLTGIVVAALGAAAVLWWLLYVRLPGAGIPVVHGDHGRNLPMLLLLLDRDAERPLIVAFAALFIFWLGTAAMMRWRTGRRLRKEDGLLLAALAMLAGSFLLDPPHAQLLYLPERAQFTGILLLAVWASMQPGWRWSWIPMSAVVALHLLRLGYVERRMAGYRERQEKLIESAAHLRPGSVVVPAYCERDWLLAHQPALLVARHPGVVFASRDHLHYRWDEAPRIELITYLKTFEGWWGWLDRHNREGSPPVIDHVLVIGRDAQAWSEQAPLLAPVLERDYALAFDNGYVAVHTRREATDRPDP